jgi:hypothetical protein
MIQTRFAMKRARDGSPKGGDGFGSVHDSPVAAGDAPFSRKSTGGLRNSVRWTEKPWPSSVVTLDLTHSAAEQPSRVCACADIAKEQAATLGFFEEASV